MLAPREPSYFLAPFSEQSWREFRAQGVKVYGTTKNKQTRAQKLVAGDLLICYISKRRVFAGVLRVTAPMRYDETPIFGQEMFPVRFDVEVLVAVDPDDGLPVEQLRYQLTILRRAKNPKFWGGFFINAFNQFPMEDGELIVELLRSKER